MGNIFKSPLIQKKGGIQGSPLGDTSGESMTDSIRKQQMELRELFKSSTASSSSTPTSTSIILESIGKPPGISKSKKKKDKKTKKTLIKVLMEEADVPIELVTVADKVRAIEETIKT